MAGAGDGLRSNAVNSDGVVAVNRDGWTAGGLCFQRVAGVGNEEDGEGMERGLLDCQLPGVAGGGVTAREGYDDFVVLACFIGFGGGEGKVEERARLRGDSVWAGEGFEELIERHSIEKAGDDAAGRGGDGVFRDQVDQYAYGGGFAATVGVVEAGGVDFAVEDADALGPDAVVKHAAFEHGCVELEELLIGDKREAVLGGRSFCGG